MAAWALLSLGVGAAIFFGATCGTAVLVEPYAPKWDLLVVAAGAAGLAVGVLVFVVMMCPRSRRP